MLGRGSSKSGDRIEGAQELDALGATAEVAVGGCVADPRD